MKRRCGELFTTGLSGYRWNYAIVKRIGSTEFHEMIRDRFLESAVALLWLIEPEDAYPYAKEIINNQERMLSDAMHGGRHNDYDQLHRGFQSHLHDIGQNWDRKAMRKLETDILYEKLMQEYRVVLMGLAGRAIVLTESGKMADATLYLDAARAVCYNTRQLAGAIVCAISKGEQSGFSLWSEWQMEEAERGEGIMMFLEQYPLNFFTLRLMELVADPVQPLDMRGNAKKALNWFMDNSERLQSYVQPVSGMASGQTQQDGQPSSHLRTERRRELAIEALEQAVHNDEVEEDRKIIMRDLSEERVSNFISEVYATAFAANVVESKFEQEGKFLYLQGDSEHAPKESRIHKLVEKALFTEAREGDRAYYETINGVQFGHIISNGTAFLLCEALDSAPESKIQTNTPKEFLRAIDSIKEELKPSGEMVIVLAGNWLDLELALNWELPDGYEPERRHELGETGRYLENSILRGPRNGESRIYVVEPGTWGYLKRAQFENKQDLRVEVNPVSDKRAEKLLNANPHYFPDEPDREGKLRKLQTQVEIIVSARIEFCETDSSRARRIVNHPHL